LTSTLDPFPIAYVYAERLVDAPGAVPPR
jgi:hypothetical protein